MMLQHKQIVLSLLNKLGETVHYKYAFMDETFYREACYFFSESFDAVKLFHNI